MFPATKVPTDYRPKELDRVMALPRRAVVDCEREPGTRRWTPEAQALVEIVTARYTRGPRLSCGCQARTVQATGGGRILVSRVPSPGVPPLPPLDTTVEAFCADNAHDGDTCALVAGLRSGQEVALPGLGHSFCITQLNPVQAWTLRELPRSGGIFGLKSVGSGKTYSGILAALAVPGLGPADAVVLLAKPDQRLHYRNHYLRLREHFFVPSIVFNYDKSGMKGSFFVEGAPTLHFVPYSLLSNPKSTLLLEQLNPKMIVADECHLLASRQSSRSTRFLRYMREHNGIQLACWSGSLVKKSLKDAAHLAAHSLGLGSPYPIGDNEVDAWAAVIDPSPVPDTYSQTAKALRRAFGGRDYNTGTLRDLNSNDGVNQGFRDRSMHTLGVISTRSSSISCSISINERVPTDMPQKVKEALSQVRGWERPDGEELVEAVEQARCAREVGSGFFYRFVFPRGESPELIEDWRAKRKAYNKALRAKLMHGDPHLDSPMLCARAAERAYRKPRYEGDLPVWPEESWPSWSDIKDQVEPVSKAVWIDDYLARDAASWALENKGIVWTQSNAFGRKIAEISGLNYHGGGPEAEAKIFAEDGSKSIIASIKAHGTGRDGLQFRFSKQLIAELPSSADAYEQLFGRLAREGQKEDTVETEIYLHTAENRDALRKAIMFAEFIEATTPNRQALLMADMGFSL